MDTQYPLPNGDPYALLDDFDPIGHAPDARQVRGIAWVASYMVGLLQHADEFYSVDRVRRFVHLLNLCQRTARWTRITSLLRLSSGIGHFAVFHGHGPQQPNAVRNPTSCYADMVAS
jgi:hypothetical protein